MLFTGLQDDGSVRKNIKTKSAKKKKARKTIEREVTLEVESESELLNREAQEKLNSDNEEIENKATLNVDSLIHTYREESQSNANINFLVDLVNDDDNEGAEEYESAGVKSMRFSRMFKKQRGAVEKTRQNLIKKTVVEEDNMDQAGQILRKVAAICILLRLINNFFRFSTLQ
jgi:hypothetical protein